MTHLGGDLGAPRVPLARLERIGSDDDDEVRANSVRAHA